MNKIYSILALSLLLVIQINATGIDFSIYHKTPEIYKELEQLQKSCSQKLEITTMSDNPDLRAIKINQNASKKYKGFLLFGEHPREMISAETGLELVKTLCSDQTELAQSVNQLYSLDIIVNANPISRSKVEDGDFCLRENENGVDINRNYDSHWERNDDDFRQVNSGKKPFSEIETQQIRDLMTKQQPHYFVTVHSGTLGLFTPFGYSEEIPEKNGEEMLKIMDEINDEYCAECSVGAAGKAVGYLCPGTSLDYAYENLDTPYSYAMEIFQKGVDVEEELQRQEENMSLLSQQVKIKQYEKRNLRNANAFVQTQSSMKSQETLFDNEYEKCFTYFNPEGKEHYEFVVKNWTNALFKSMKLTAEQLDKDTK